MKVLIRQALIIDPSSPFHSQRADISIHNGLITDIGKDLSADADKIISHPGLCVSTGWVDPFAHFGDPGTEFTETAETGGRAAAAGGYTDVMVLPNTTPVMHTKSLVEYIRQKNLGSPVNLYPVAAVTVNAEGKDLAEMYDMHSSGAVAFTDGWNPVQSSGVLLKALQYLKAIDKTLIQVPDDRSVQPHGLMNEGVMSTTLGLPGKPAIAEELMIIRDIELLKYTESRLHITGISSARSIDLIRKAKEEGLKITCSVTPYHLQFTEEDLSEYDTHLKLNPPLRTSEDRTALRAAVLDGTIDCIASHHMPRHTDNKIVEFENAKNGMTGLQTAFAVVAGAMKGITETKLADLFTAPRRIFDLPAVSIDKGKPACVTLFSNAAEWTFDIRNNQSRSVNSPFFGITFNAKAIAIINKGSLFLKEHD